MPSLSREKTSSLTRGSAGASPSRTGSPQPQDFALTGHEVGRETSGPDAGVAGMRPLLARRAGEIHRLARGAFRPVTDYLATSSLTSTTRRAWPSQPLEPSPA